MCGQNDEFIETILGRAFDDVKDQVQDLIKQYENQVNDMAKSREADVMEED